ncbi:MAG: oligosaccharide flippase family protein [Sedimenticola sp.]
MTGYNRFHSLVASTLTTNMLIMLATLVVGSLTAKILGVEGRGELAAIQLVASFLGGVCIAGLPAAVIYLSGANGRYSGHYYMTGMLLAMLLAVPTIIVGYAVAPFILNNNRLEVIEAARTYLVFIPLTILSSFILASFQGQLKIRVWNRMRAIAYVLWLGPVLWMYVRGGVGPVEFSKIYLIFVAVYVVLFLFIQYREQQGEARFRTKLVRPLLSYGGSTTFANLLQQSNLRLDQIFITAFLLPTQLGIYVVALAWSGAYAPFIGAVSNIIVPYISRIESTANQIDLLGRISRVIATLNLLLSALLMLVTPIAIHLLFGEAFEAAVPIAYVLIVALMLANLKGVLSESLRGMGKPGVVMRAEIIGVVVTAVLLAVVLVASGELIAVAISSVVGYAATLVYLAVYLQRKMHMPMTKLFIPTRSDLAYVIRSVQDLLQRARGVKSSDARMTDA